MKRYAIIYPLSLLLLAACQQEDYTDVPDVGSPIVLHYAHRAGTRGGASTTLIDGTELPAGLQINGYLSDDVTDRALTGSPTVWTTAAGGVLDPSPKVFYPAASHTVTAYGVYPAAQVNSSSTSFTVQASQNTNDGYLKSDLMWARLSGFTETSADHVLNFSHKLSKLLVNVSSETCTVVSATIGGVARTIGFTPSTGVLGSTSNTGTVAVFTSGTGKTAKAAAVVPPQTVASGSDILTLSIIDDNGATKTAIFRLTAALPLLTGRVYTLNITVDKWPDDPTTGHVMIVPVGVITNFNNGGTNSGQTYQDDGIITPINNTVTDFNNGGTSSGQSYQDDGNITPEGSVTDFNNGGTSSGQSYPDDGDILPDGTIVAFADGGTYSGQVEGDVNISLVVTISNWNSGGTYSGQTYEDDGNIIPVNQVSAFSDGGTFSGQTYVAAED